jgi:hypothetical protein
VSVASTLVAFSHVNNPRFERTGLHTIAQHCNVSFLIKLANVIFASSSSRNLPFFFRFYSIMSHQVAASWSNSVHMWFSAFLVLRIIVIWLALKTIMAFDEKGPSLTVALNLRGSGGSKGGGSKGSTRSSREKFDNGEAGEVPFWGVFVVFGIFASVVLCILGGFCIVSCRQLWPKKHVQETTKEVESE